MKLTTTKIALFGTSADPPTKGHKRIIEELSGIFSFVISYASDNPSKTHKEDLTNRSLLLKILIEDMNSSKIIFDQEISSPWAIKSIIKCKLKYNSDNVHFVIGSDLIEQMFLWRNFNEIIKESELFIIPREGYPINPRILDSIELNNGKYFVSSFKVPNISSSMVRSNNLSSELPKSLVQIVKSKNLYRNLK